MSICDFLHVRKELVVHGSGFRESARRWSDYSWKFRRWLRRRLRRGLIEVSQKFCIDLFFGNPPVRTWVAIRTALGVHLKLADLTFHDVILPVDAFSAPKTKIMIYQWAGPLVSVKLQMSRMKMQVAVRAVLGDTFRYGAEAKCALNSVL